VQEYYKREGATGLAGRGRAKTTEGEVVDNVLATLDVVLERVELATKGVVTEVELYCER
jgi:hypothetical protein